VDHIARDVWWLPLGRGLQAVNVYFVASHDVWCLVDAGWPKHANEIREAAAGLFGSRSRPAAILLTHCHPDHAGAARELALEWRCDVLMHPRDLPLADPDERAVRECGGPLDRWVILPAMRLMGARRMQAALKKSALGSVARPLDPPAPPHGLDGWTVLPAPGHTPGHVVLLRATDGVVITGDALCTIDLNSPVELVRQRPALGYPPWITTCDWTAAKASAAAVAALGPRVIAPGHGVPMQGAEASRHIRRFLAGR
jgi:glyoxylase-like metal-dependent hydrolase (beta-lactamase superfamily II)